MPVEFAEFAQLRGEMTFVGKARRFQIHNTEAYAKIADNARKAFSKSKLTIKKPLGA